MVIKNNYNCLNKFCIGYQTSHNTKQYCLNIKMQKCYLISINFDYIFDISNFKNIKSVAFLKLGDFSVNIQGTL